MFFDMLKCSGKNDTCGECGGTELRDLIDYVNHEGGFELTRQRVNEDSEERSLTRGGGRRGPNRTVDLLNVIAAVSEDPDPTPINSIFGRTTPLDQDVARPLAGSPVQNFSQPPFSDEDVIRFGINPEDTGVQNFSLTDNLRSLIRNLG